MSENEGHDHLEFERFHNLCYWSLGKLYLVNSKALLELRVKISRGYYKKWSNNS